MFPGPNKDARLHADPHFSCTNLLFNTTKLKKVGRGTWRHQRNEYQRSPRHHGVQAAQHSRGSGGKATGLLDDRCNLLCKWRCESAASASAEHFVGEEAVPSISASSEASSESADTIETGEVRAVRSRTRHLLLECHTPTIRALNITLRMVTRSIWSDLYVTLRSCLFATVVPQHGSPLIGMPLSRGIDPEI